MSIMRMNHTSHARAHAINVKKAMNTKPNQQVGYTTCISVKFIMGERRLYTKKMSVSDEMIIGYIDVKFREKTPYMQRCK